MTDTGPQVGPRIAGGRALRNFSLQLSGELIGQAIAFVAALYLARALDAHGFGVWVFASSVLLYFTIVIDGGTDVWGMREVAARPRRLRPLVSAIIASRLLLGAAAIVAVVIFAQLVDRDDGLALLVGLPILVAFMFNISWAHKGLETGMTGLTVVLQRLTWLIFALLLITTPADASFATFWQGLSEITGVAVLFLLLIPRLRSQGRIAAKIPVGAVFAHSWPLALARAMRAFTATFAIVVLNSTNPSTEVGEYGAALRVGTILVLVSSVFSNAAFPGLSRACRGTNQAIVIGAAMRLLATVIAPIAVGGAILSGPFIQVLFPPDFADAATMLAILMLAYAAMAVSDLLRRILTARHHQQLDLKLTAAGTAVSLIATLWLATDFGGIGAAIAMVIGEVIVALLALWGVARTGPAVAIARESFRPVAGAVLMGAVVWLAADFPLLARIGLGVLTYLAWLKLAHRNLVEDLNRMNQATVGSARPVTAERPVGDLVGG